MSAPSVDLASDGPGRTSPAEPSATPRSAWVTADRPRWLIALAAATVALPLLWIGAVILTVGHGVDISDEGLYLLSYRWWNVDYHTFTGSQFFYGPVFALLGHNIAALRVFRLLTVVGVHVIFGWTFMRWLRGHRPAAPQSRLWELSGTAAIVACGGIVYSWIPLSPGYNDISVLGSLLATSVVVRMATLVDRGSPIRPWVPAALGPIAVVMGVGKWSSAAVTLLIVALVAIVVLARRGIREVLLCIGWALAGGVVFAGFMQVFVIPLTKVVPEMIATTRDTSNGGASIQVVLDGYREGLHIVRIELLKAHWPLLVAAAVAALVPRRTVWRIVGAALAAVGLVVSVFRIVADGDFRGGAANVLHFPVPLMALTGVALIVGLLVALDWRRTGDGGSSIRRSGWAGWALLCLLVLLPFSQAFGTMNYLTEVAIIGLASWAAVVIMVLTGIEAAPWPARKLLSASMAAMTLLAVVIATNGIWRHPYRIQPRQDTTVAVAGVPALSSVLVDPGEAARWSALRAELAPYLEPEGRAIMAFDEMAGVVFLLGGRSVGEQWYDSLNHERTANGIRAACASGHPWWGTRSPLLIFNRKVSDTETSALRSCGLDFATDYRQLPPRPELDGWSVYVPVAG